MKRAPGHLMRLGLAAAALVVAGTAAFAYDRAGERPRDAMAAEDDAGLGIDFIVTGPVRRGAAESVPANVSAAAAEKPVVRHRMRKN